jgi:hypothetical protein
LFESYHKLDSVKVFGTEKVPCVGELETYRFPIFQPEKETGFYHSNSLFLNFSKPSNKELKKISKKQESKTQDKSTIL